MDASQQPLSAFSSFSFHPSIQRAIVSAGYTEPTPIQAQAIPVALAGKDILGLAQTGTGKTAAFALPIIQKLLGVSEKDPRALILVPTRELAAQVHSVFKAMSFGSGLKTAEVFGGVGIERQIRDLRAGVDILIACPGRLLDLIERRCIQFARLQVLVLDEADQMFDMGFLPSIRRILRILPVKRQNLLFSATMPRELRGLAMEVLKSPTTVEVSRGEAAGTIAHSIYEVTQEQKGALLEKLLPTITDSVLVFTRTKHRAKRLAQSLKGLDLAVTSLQGNLSQGQRQRAMAGFRSGEYQILVATDIAARGIDISTVSHVINFDIPSTVDAYVHRIGRTGRAARNGDALTFVTREDVSMVRDIERRLGFRLQRNPVPELPQIAARSDGGNRPARGGGGGRADGSSRGGAQGSWRHGGGQNRGGSGHRSNGSGGAGRSNRSRFGNSGQGAGRNSGV
jgi:ATP-dependent RNA helicase RhlE